MKNLNALLKIEFMLVKRNISSFIVGIGLPLMIFLLMSKMLENNYPTEIRPYMVAYIMVSMTVYSSISFALFSFPMLFVEDRNNHWLDFVKRSPVSMCSYYTAKMIRIIFNFFIAICVVFLVGKVFKGVDFTAKQWVSAGAIIMGGAFLMLPIGFLLSTIKSAEKLSLVSNVIYISLSMIGGLWWPIESFPNILQKIGKLTPTYHINHIVQDYLKENVFHYNSLAILVGYAIVLIIVALFIKNKLENNQ